MTFRNIKALTRKEIITEKDKFKLVLINNKLGSNQAVKC